MTDVPAKSRFSESPALSPRTRAWLLLAVGVLHLGLGFAIATGLAGSAITLIQNAATAAYSVPLDPPPPSPPPANPVPTPEPAGAEGSAAKQAKPKPVAAAPARIPTKAMTAAPAASTGDATKSGATSAGTGTGGGTTGAGTGSGGNGDGAGSGASRAVKIAGDITATRDYPARTREQRIGKSVIVVLTVGTDGRVSACRIHQPSPDAEADTITCRLAVQRFRFRPATDRAGNPITSEFGWQQRWFAP
ncbi:TonB family protein [Novosphingobium sp. PASSN1]|uniref:TonB family protein n=1 Tax=Novosphingobium sp. PASSN1 TaxID=2015561 RepID=UPI000BD57E4D|nr:TonB family protein [Novosphingobium sp. PASSN1]OYU33236.1 MAG: energy transducer TonB [Novosphingobium sp. PASSN1]